ncbi:MAG: STAS domain-containing protein [Steroidobacteraceae bacterium]
MKTRKRKTPPAKRSHRPAQRRTGEPRAAAVRKKAAPVPADTAALSLPAECTVAEADCLKAALVRLLKEPRSVNLQVGSVRRIDTAAVQLLAAFVRDRRAAGREIAWRGRAPVLDAAAGLLGLRGMLELPAEDGR